MYCPNCGQQQIAGNTRFCSRCGLPTDQLSEWLAGGGALVVNEKDAAPRLPSSKQKGVRLGAKVLLSSLVLGPIFLGLSLFVDGPVPLFVPVTVFLAGVAILLYAAIFGDDTPAARPKPARSIGQNAARDAGALPPASTLWATGAESRRVRTAEIVQPPSVTENTTKLLSDE
jgi:hypothetical protein